MYISISLPLPLFRHNYQSSISEYRHTQDRILFVYFFMFDKIYNDTVDVMSRLHVSLLPCMLLGNTTTQCFCTVWLSATLYTV